MGEFKDLFARLDPDPRVRGKQFEHVCKWFLTNDPVYKYELRRVWLWEEWTGRWGGDAGIDLVAEDRTGNLWAIQAKAYDPAYRVTKRDVNKFLAESGRAVFSYRMLIATTNLIDRVGERTIQDQEKRVTFFRLKNLQTADVDWPASPNALRPMRPRKPARPHDYQREAINKVINGFGSVDRGQLIMACGTGKTLTALFIREKLAAERTLVLVPSLSLLKQTLNVWRANCNAQFVSLPVCSDDTVARGDDVALEHTSDLGVPVTTDPSEIAAFLRRRSGPQVVFATYQSSPQIAKAFTLGRVPGFDLVVSDEAHRCAGPVSSDFATVLDPVEIKAKRRLFMTATPRYFTGRVLKAAEEAEFEYASMDDETKFGTVFHRLGFGEAIKRDLLTDYQVAIVGVDDATYLEWAKRGALVTRDGVKITDAASLAGQIGLMKAIRKYDLHRVISFHSRVKRAREFAASMPEVLVWMPARQRPKGELWSRYASGEMPAGDRYVLLQHLGRLNDGDRGLLANARCLAEGVDVPTLDGVAFIDPRRSEVDIVQAVGRAIRKSEDKTIGTIVIPVFIDTKTDPEAALDSSAFKPIWDVLEALRAHDEELSEQLDAVRRAMGRKGSRPRLPDKVHVDIPVKVNADFARAFDIRLVEQTTASWHFRFGLLEKFVEREGHARVPEGHIENGVKLGSWVLGQRMNKAKMREARRTRLEALPGWTWNPHADAWEQGYAALAVFAARKRHARVPSDHIEDGVKLGVWVKQQRRGRRSMSDERRQRLESVVGWSWNALEDSWNEHLALVKAFAARKGHTRVPVDYVEDGLKLGQWVRLRRREREKLSPERKALLEGIRGWYWGRSADFVWDQKFGFMQRFVDREGHARVPAGHIEDGVNLGGWVAEQRAERRNLPPERVAQLEALQGWSWTVSQDVWGERYELLRSFVDREGHARVPQRHVENGVNLGKWVSVQRQKRGSLTTERRALLEAVPGWSWDPFGDQWEQAFSLLRNYVRHHRTSRVPYSHKVDGIRLGVWVSEQRSQYAKGKLDPSRQKRLERLPGWTWAI